MAAHNLIDCATLAERLGDPGWRIFDCRFDLADTGRGAAAYAQGHIPGAFYAHLDHDLSGPITPHSGRHPLPDPAALGAWLGRHGVAADTRVVAYDDSGGSMAVRLWWLLRWLGHRAVVLLDGGWPAWQRTGLPIETAPPAAVRAARFRGSPDWDQVVTSAQIEHQLAVGAAEPLLLDARTAPRFRGEAEPIDPVAGHIPGARNLPLQDNLDPDGTFRPPAALRTLYLAALSGHRPQDVAAMCGSGVTACHNLLAMELAGLPGGRLYAGSWSEWIRDPARPVARGD
jgi:thiosulfate/3-mercaptopyruvate sulfurtransferase